MFRMFLERLIMSNPIGQGSYLDFFLKLIKSAVLQVEKQSFKFSMLESMTANILCVHGEFFL